MANSYNSNGLSFLANRYIHKTLESRYEHCEYRFNTIMGRSKKYRELTDDEKGDILFKHLSSTTNNAPNETVIIKENINALLDFLEINNEITREIMLFIVVSACNYNLRVTISSIGSYSTYPARYFSDLLKVSLEQAKTNFFKLASTGLIIPDLTLSESDRLMSPAILDAMLGPALNNPQQILESILIEAPRSTIDIDLFDCEQATDIADYLKGIDSHSEALGINILIYGEPGTGKTEMARTISHVNDKRLFEITPTWLSNFENKDELDGADTYTGVLRMQYYGIAQKLLKHNSESYMIVDECEDVFFTTPHFRHLSKDKIHQIMTENQRPCFWITNHIESIDDSVLRRFKWVVKMPKPSIGSKQALLNNAFKDMDVNASFIKNLSKSEHLTPALISHAKHICLASSAKGKKAERLIESTVNNYLEVTGKQCFEAQYQAELPYSVDFLNIKGDFDDLTPLLKSYATFPASRALLYGPAGTGKTAFAHYIAEKTGFELKVVRSSDILGPYIGESEQNLARIFREAKKRKQMLLIDEVDSLIASRQNLEKNWERQLVNEFLTQIECFQQPLFATTNFFDSLDLAVLRRFDHKIQLDYLTTEQVYELFSDVAGSPPTQAQKQTLAALKQLTPGDFAIVKRKQHITGEKSGDSLIKTLQQENELKEPQGNIGFI